MKRLALAGVCFTALTLAFSACQKEVANETDLRSETALMASGKSDGSKLMQKVRMATSRFNSTTQAMKAGYMPDDHCVSHPMLGGMGYHWANFSLVDDVFDPTQPEVLVYSTGDDGELELGAVEYIVMNEGQSAPMFGSQAFMVGGTPVPDPHWSLHVWMYKANPSGIFAPFNPDVTCP